MAALPGSGGDVLGRAFRAVLRFLSEVCEDTSPTRNVDELNLYKSEYIAFPINISISRSLALISGSARDLCHSIWLRDADNAESSTAQPFGSTRLPAYLPSIPLQFLAISAGHLRCRIVCFDRRFNHTS